MTNQLKPAIPAEEKSVKVGKLSVLFWLKYLKSVQKTHFEPKNGLFLLKNHLKLVTITGIAKKLFFNSFFYLFYN